MLHILVLTGLLFKASTSQITSYGNSTGDYGGDAHYTCSLLNPTGVRQVTWQRRFKDESTENLATYSNQFGQQVNEPYQGKVIFTQASLSSTSITLRNVTWEDDSCYICSFNVYPDGSKETQTCLTVQGISQVTTGVEAPSSELEGEDGQEVVFSCSATGKPAPTIQWAYSPDVLLVNQPRTTTASNRDHTFTSSRNVTLEVPLGWSGHVDCLLNSGMMGQRRERIFFSDEERHDKKEEEGDRLSASGVALVVSAVVFVSLIAVGAALKRKRLKGNRRNENV
ncbi:nectin-1-like [Chaetodon auriga]|uniref:nectin-1-like n=1 Tax=Chaetodon auriga TaxID=39042 RepID=UPI004032EAF5